MTTSTSEYMDEKEPGDDADDALFRRLRRWYKESSQHLGDWKEQAKEDYAFVAGDQWTEEDRTRLKEQLRPEITFNRVGPVIDSVAGMEVGNRQEVTYLPREVGDSGVNEMLTNAAKFFREESEAEDEESDAFQDAIVCGLGCTETRPDFEQDSDGLIPTDRIDPLCTFYDPNARKHNLTDRRYCGYVKEMAIEDARAMFPDAEDEDLHAPWAEGVETDQPHDATPQNAYEHGDEAEGGKLRQNVSIVYFEWWEREPYYVAHDPFTGKKIELDPRQHKTVKKRLADMGKAMGVALPELKAAKLTRKRHKLAFVGAKVLQTGPGRCPDEFTVNFITGKRDRNNNTWYGLVRGMKDPQRWANKFFSTILHRISTTGKGVVMEKTAVDNPRAFEDDWSRADAVKWVRDGAIAKGQFQQLEGTAIVPAESNMLEFAISSIRDVTGVNLEMMGLADRDQPGILEHQRKQAGMMILATLFDSLRRYRKQQGRALLYIIQNYIPEGRLIRIDSVNGPKYVQLAKSAETAKYDVIVDESSTSPNLKEAVWAMVMQMMPLLGKLQIPPQMWAKLLEYSPLPESLTQDLSQMIQQQASQPPPPNPQMIAAQAKVQAMQAKAQIDQQGAQLDAAQQQQQMQMDAQAQAQEMAFEREKFLMETQQDQAKFHQEMMQTQMLGQVKMHEAQAVGAQKIALGQQQGEAKIEQMKKQAAAKPKPAPKR